MSATIGNSPHRSWSTLRATSTGRASRRRHDMLWVLRPAFGVSAPQHRMQIAPAFRLRPNAVRSHLKAFGRVAIKVHRDSKPPGDMMKIFPGLALLALVA